MHAPAGTASTKAADVADSLVEVEATLRALDRTCLAAASALLPPVTGDRGICARYREVPPLSYERQAEIHACLHDAGATLRAAAECCRRARGLLDPGGPA